MSHISETSPKVNESFTEDTLFLEFGTPDFNSLEEKTQNTAVSVLLNRQDEFDEWDVFNAEDAERCLRINDEMPSENLAFKGIDYELLNFLNCEESQEDSFLISKEKTETASSSVFVETQNHKRKRSTTPKDEETRETNHRRLDAEQELDQSISSSFLNHGLLTDQDFIDHSNSNSFLTNLTLDTSEKSIEQTAFDEWLYTTSPLRFDDGSIEITNLRNEHAEETSCHLINEIDTSEKSIEQTSFDEWFYASNPLRFDEEQIETSVSIEKEESGPNANLWERAHQRLQAINLTRVHEKPREEPTKQPRNIQSTSKKRTPAQQAHETSNYIKRMLRENAFIEQVLTSDASSSDEQTMKMILRKRKKTPETVREVEMSGFSRNFRLLNLWLLNQRLTPNQEKDVKENLLKEIQRYRETRKAQQTGTATDT